MIDYQTELDRKVDEALKKLDTDQIPGELIALLAFPGYFREHHDRNENVEYFEKRILQEGD